MMSAVSGGRGVRRVREVRIRMRWGIARWLASAPILAAVAGCSAAAGQTQTSPGAEPFEAILERLARRGALYEKAALGFSCEETVLVGKFSSRTGESRREESTLYDAMYEGNPKDGYQLIRLLIARNGEPRIRRLEEPDLDIPGAYDWALLFTGAHRPYFRFEDAGEEILDTHAARAIAFAGAAAFDRGRKIEEWSGRVWVERETGNFLRVEATPNHQEELLPIRYAEWLKGFRFLGGPAGRQPKGYRYLLRFTVERFSLTFPGEAITEVFVLTMEGGEQIRQRIAQQFRNYVFFNVKSEEEFLGGGAGTAPPPAP
jgi:hypothetical protein